MTRFFVLFFSALLLIAPKSKASHILGGEIGYTHLTGNTYEIYLIIYGDCSGSAYNNLYSAVPRIQIYKDGVANSYTDLVSFGTLGLEVTPVCPSEAANTTCTNPSGIIPGVGKFVYKNTVNLIGTSAHWQFLFNGSFGGGGGGSAGRSGAITNITGGVTLMGLIATLNNVNGPNNSANFTTIPTPFFCINQQQEYNQGAIDSDGDQLSFALVPGLVTSTGGTVTGTVTYVSPYTYNSPLAVAPGSFVFNSTNGQMSFIPNQVQTSLVVNKVIEMRGTDTVGTAMREMNLIILNNCNNQPPTSSIPTSNEGSFDSTRTMTLCIADSTLHFVIHGSDPDSTNNVNLSLIGLPAGATATVTSNDTPSPVIDIVWNIPQPLVSGTYNFYVNCVDDGCPLSSHQTFAYTVNLYHAITSADFLISNATCVPGFDGSIVVDPALGLGINTYSLDGGPFQTSNVFNGLTGGVYTVTVKNSEGCTYSKDTTVLMPDLPILSGVTATTETCIPGKDAIVQVYGSSVNGGVDLYSLSGITPQDTGIFNNLSAGLYTVTVTDFLGCTATTTITVPAPSIPSLDSIKSTNITCYGLMNGSIDVEAFPSSMIYSYQLFPNAIYNGTGVFNNLDQGNYTLIVFNDKLCSDTAYFNLTQPDPLFFTNLNIQNATCDRNNATLQVGTTSLDPLIYTLRPATYINTNGVFNNITPGYYTVNVHDSNYCSIDSLIYIGADPNNFSSSITHQDLACNGWGYEGEAEVIATGGVQPYSYLWSTEPPSTDKHISNLFYGWYFVDVVDATGCAIKNKVFINPGTCCENVYLPSAFTPNSDGNNDEWKAVTSTGLAIDQFAVYDRWGKQIWHTNDQRESWDGRQDGRDLEVGTYFYMLKYKCLSDGKNYIKKGDVTILR